jgi:hypothetical protein
MVLFILEADGSAARVYVMRWNAVDGLLCAVSREHATTFDVNDDVSMHKANIMQTMLNHLCAPLQIQFEVFDAAQKQSE